MPNTCPLPIATLPALLTGGNLQDATGITVNADGTIRLVAVPQQSSRTALGSDEAELGFAGFAVQTGGKSALASLWNVSDEGTLGLMTEFYRQLRTAPIKAEALRQAQIAMLKGDVRVTEGRLRSSRSGAIELPIEVSDHTDTHSLAHPYYWAAFTLIGNPW